MSDVGIDAVVTGVPVKSPAADFDGDGVVGISDFLLFCNPVRIKSWRMLDMMCCLIWMGWYHWISDFLLLSMPR